MGLANLLSSALTAVATLSGNPDVQEVANSANELVVSYQTQQQQDMAYRILNSPDGIVPFTEKGQTLWRALQYDSNGDIIGFADFSTKEEYLLLRQQQEQEQLYAEQQRLKAEQTKAEQQRLKAEQAKAEQRATTSQSRSSGISIADIDAYGSMVSSIEQAAAKCTQFYDDTPPWHKCMQYHMNKAH